METPPSKYRIDELCSLFIGQKFLEIHLHDGLFDVTTVERILGKVEDYTGGKEYLTVINCEDGARTTISALRRMGEQSAMQYATAKAYVISTLHHRLMANIYFLFFRPQRPVKFFRTTEAAREWLSVLP